MKKLNRILIVWIVIVWLFLIREIAECDQSYNPYSYLIHK